MKFFYVIFFIIILINNKSAWACKIPQDSEWNFNEEKIIQKTKNIWIGKIVNVKKRKIFENFTYEIELLVEKNLKGDKVAGEKVKIGPFYKSSNTLVSYNKDCKLSIPFEINESNVVLEGAFHSKAISKVQKGSNIWIMKIESLNK